MSRRSLGVALMALGALAVVIGAIGMVAGPGGSSSADVAGTTTSTASVTSTSVAVTSTAPASTTSTAVTTTAASTTTTIDPVDLILAFAEDFAGLIEAGDSEKLLELLHPASIEEWDVELCRGFIEREILALVDYRSTGDPGAPELRTFGSYTVEHYSMPVAFTFQGQEFTADAGFAFVDGEVRWFAACR